MNDPHSWDKLSVNERLRRDQCIGISADQMLDSRHRAHVLHMNLYLSLVNSIIDTLGTKEANEREHEDSKQDQ